jgi:hypothetical protein
MVDHFHYGAKQHGVTLIGSMRRRWQTPFGLARKIEQNECGIFAFTNVEANAGLQMRLSLVH